MMQASLCASNGTSVVDTCVKADSVVMPESIMVRFAAWLVGFWSTGVLRAGTLLLAILALAFVSTGVKAACTITAGTAPEAVNFTPPTTITVSYNLAVGSVLYQSGAVTPISPNSMNCTGNALFGVDNNVGTQPGPTVTVYPIGTTGISYSIGHTTAAALLKPYPCCNIANGTYTNSTVSFLTLIKTGPIVSGTTLPAGTIAYWQYAGIPQLEAFNLANSVTILDPACSVNASSANFTVALPTVSSSALSAIGATAGSTPFTIALTCFAGATLDIEFDSVNATATPGVISKAAGSSVGVGVQLVDKNFNPVIFGSVTLVGSTTGLSSIKYYARYYRTAAITPGTLTAIATFTLSYE